MALAAVVLWGTTFVSTKTLLGEGLTPADIMFYRFLQAYIIMWLFSPHFHWPKNFKDELLFIGAGICGGSLYFLTENSALKLTLASNVALLVGTAPILTVIFSRLLLKTGRLRHNLIIGSIVALIGVACVVYNGSFILQIHPWGDLLSLTAALTWALYNIILKKLDGKYDTLYITRKLFFYGVLTLTPVPASDYGHYIINTTYRFRQFAIFGVSGFSVLLCHLESGRKTTGNHCHKQLHLYCSVSNPDLLSTDPERTNYLHGFNWCFFDSRWCICG